MEFYQSKALVVFSNCSSNPSIKDAGLSELEKEMCYQNWKKSLEEETSQNGLTNEKLWKELEINDLGKFREVFMDYGQNGTPDYPRYLWQNSVNTWSWSSKVKIALGKSNLPAHTLYDFKKINVLDDAVYGSLDIFGVVPGIDTFTDPIGAAYAMARSDIKNVTIYSASAVLPLVGVAYVRGGAKALSKAEPTVVLIAKKADNTDGFELIYKSIDEIQPDEFYVASAIDGKQNKAFLEETKKYVDKTHISEQLDQLAKSKNSATTDKVDDAVKKVGEEVKEAVAKNADIIKQGKFIDEVLEADYQKYLVRKAKEGKTPKDRLEWKEARDYWLNDSPLARGNKFNDTAKNNEWYDFNEVHLENGKRLDSYDPDLGEIVSRKATDLESVELSTFESYLKEMKNKYSAGIKIRSDKYPRLDGQILKGKQILEIPESNKDFDRIQEYIDLAKNKYNIEIRFRPE
ncbi:hypothetical protein CAPN003_24200 [Capnocytophaga stomatis]|nr:hypothetical protein CAPN003_24200 [Capnocytophaga stomatis]